jgi:large-conductance mechanosensitive channel
MEVFVMPADSVDNANSLVNTETSLLIPMFIIFVIISVGIYLSVKYSQKKRDERDRKMAKYIAEEMKNSNSTKAK